MRSFAWSFSIFLGDKFKCKFKQWLNELSRFHPSGEPEPSGQDMEVTSRISRAGKILGIEVLDHVIIGAGGRYVSLKERGALGGDDDGVWRYGKTVLSSAGCAPKGTLAA